MTTTINIHNREDAETELLADVLTRISHHQHLATADIYVTKRESNGWIEYLAVLKYDEGGKLTIGCLQRSAGARTEFHS